MAITLFYLIFYLVSFRKINFSAFKWLAWLGALTYPLYLIHSDIGFIAWHRLDGHVNKYLLLGGMLAAIFLLAYLIHALIEKRFSKSLGAAINRRMTYLAQES